MSADNYIKHIAEAAYKNTVKNKSHTDNNLTWYEEPETVTPRVDARSYKSNIQRQHLFQNYQ